MQRPPRQKLTVVLSCVCGLLTIGVGLGPGCTTTTATARRPAAKASTGDMAGTAALDETGPDAAHARGSPDSASTTSSTPQTASPPRLPPVLATAKQIIKIAGHGDVLSAVALTPDGHHALTGSADLTVRLWNLPGYVPTTSPSSGGDTSDKGVQTRVLSGHTQPVTAVAISADGTQGLSSSLDRTVRVWDLTNGRAIRAWHGRSRYIGALAFAPTGDLAASGSHDGQVMVWNLVSGKLLAAFRAHERPINEVSFSRDGKSLLTASDDRSAVLWDWNRAMVQMRFVGHQGWVTSAALSSAGTRVLTGSADRTVRLWDSATGGELRRFAGAAGLISRVAFARGETLVVAGGGTLGPGGSMGPQDYTVRVWATATGAELGQLIGHRGPVAEVMALGSDQLLSASLDESVRLWQLPPAGLIAVAPPAKM